MASKQESLILTSIENGIQKVVLNRPAKKNALTHEMYKELLKIFNESAKDENVTVLVITGNGDFFTSGNDFVATMMCDVDVDQQLTVIEEFINTLILYPKLLIAILNGPAIGIGATTLALFDIVYASEKAYMSAPFSKLGITAEGCSTYTFPRILGPSRAGELLYFGEKLTACEAAKAGFVSRVYKTDELNEIWEHIGKVSSLSKESLAATKKLLSRWNKDILMEVNKQEVIELKHMNTLPGFAENMMKFMAARSKM